MEGDKIMKPELYTNDHDKPVYRNVELSTPMSELEFQEVPASTYDLEMGRRHRDFQVALHTNLGSLTVLDRMTGFGWRDIETGYRDMEGKFWLASGGYDVRDSWAITFEEAVNWVKQNANNCKGN